VTRFIEIQHDEWIAATPDVVRSHYADLNHRQVARVHPDERLRLLPHGPEGPRFERVVRRGWTVARDVYERHYKVDGSVVDFCVAGTNWGRSITARFWRRVDDDRNGTLVEVTVTQPLPPVVGRLLARWIRRRIEHELQVATAEQKANVERGYKGDRKLRVA
jgi:hypothetical protein